MKRHLSVNDDWSIEHVTHLVNCGTCTQAVGQAILTGRAQNENEVRHTIHAADGEHTAQVTRSP